MDLEKINNAKSLTRCLCCGSEELELVLDLNEQPMANSFKKSPDDEELTFPLRLNICKNCTHLQLSHAVNPDFLFKDYLYVSGTSKTLHNYFEAFAGNVMLNYFIKSDIPTNIDQLAPDFVSGTDKDITDEEVTHQDYRVPPRTVLDIACNDGTQLDKFKAIGMKTYGIDPAQNLHELSSRNHEVICDYFTEEYIDHYKSKKLDIIIAQNVFAHNDYPMDFLKHCKAIMHDNTRLFIQTSQAEMIKNNEFDTIYHEHLSFFNSKSMLALAERAGLTIIDIVKTPIHGTSYLFVMALPDVCDVSDNVQEQLELEQEQGLHDLSKYPAYTERCYEIVTQLKEKIEWYRSQGYVTAGYGAAAKGNTLLNFGKIWLDFIIDDNELKQGLYAPGTNIPVESIDILDECDDMKVVFIPLAWNFHTEIKEKILQKRDREDDVFIKYFPEIVVEQNVKVGA